jgi:hypothetical protein
MINTSSGKVTIGEVERIRRRTNGEEDTESPEESPSWFHDDKNREQKVEEPQYTQYDTGNKLRMREKNLQPAERSVAEREHENADSETLKVTHYFFSTESNGLRKRRWKRICGSLLHARYRQNKTEVRVEGCPSCFQTPRRVIRSREMSKS